MIEDMQLRNLTPHTQRSYVHYVAEYARYFNLSPEKLDAEAIHQYLLLPAERTEAVAGERELLRLRPQVRLSRNSRNALDHRVFPPRQTPA